MAHLLGVRQHAFGFVLADVVGVQVAAWLLNGDYGSNHTFRGPAQLRAIAGLQHKANRFHPLVDVGVGIVGPNLRSSRLVG